MIGIDIASVARIEKSIKNDAFISRVFTQKEQAYCNGRQRPAESYAGIFCAKEAAAKAIKRGFTGGLKPIDIEVDHDDNGVPLLVFYGNAGQVFSKFDADVSISHDGDYAVAAVMLRLKN
ncbi:MAG: holo-ACP synthase [Clostridiales bacterium]|nr:holo-ACP synthase [Clostridiales bacterium]